MNCKSIILHYATALIGGIVTGGLFAKSQYYKGQSDAYAEIAKDLDELVQTTEEQLEKQKEKKVD